MIADPESRLINKNEEFLRQFLLLEDALKCQFDLDMMTSKNDRIPPYFCLLYPSKMNFV